MMETVEIPKNAILTSLPWNWEDYYLDANFDVLKAMAETARGRILFSYGTGPPGSGKAQAHPRGSRVIMAVYPLAGLGHRQFGNSSLSLGGGLGGKVQPSARKKPQTHCPHA